MTEEKKAAASASTFTGFKNLISIHLRTQAFLNHCEIVFQVVVEGVHENFILVKPDFNIMFKNCSIERRFLKRRFDSTVLSCSFILHIVIKNSILRPFFQILYFNSSHHNFRPFTVFNKFDFLGLSIILREG